MEPHCADDATGELFVNCRKINILSVFYLRPDTVSIRSTMIELTSVIDGYNPAALSSLLTVANAQLTVLAFYGLVAVGVFVQFLRYAVVIPLCLRIGLLEPEVLMTCDRCGRYHGVSVTDVACEEPSPCCETGLNPPPEDCANWELYEKWGGNG